MLNEPVVSTTELPSTATPVKTVFTAKPTASPSPTIKPTPTLDPADAYYAAKGEEIIEQDWDKGVWIYKTYNLSIEAKRVVTKLNNKLVTYYVTDIRTRNGESPYCAPAKEGSGSSREWPYLIARRNDVVFGITTDYLMAAETSRKGILIRNGTVFHDGDTEDTLAIMPDGELKIFEKGTITADELLTQGVQNSYSFGPTLVKDGAIDPAVKTHRLKGLNPRSSIGMIEPGHYIALVVDGRDANHSYGMTLEQMAQVYIDLNCKLAYNLDGGVSVGMIFMGNSISQHNYETSKGQRKNTDLLAFGSSGQVPGVNDPVISKGNGVNKEVGITPTPSITPTVPAATSSPAATTEPPSTIPPDTTAPAEPSPAASSAG